MGTIDKVIEKFDLGAASKPKFPDIVSDKDEDKIASSEIINPLSNPVFLSPDLRESVEIENTFAQRPLEYYSYNCTNPNLYSKYFLNKYNIDPPPGSELNYQHSTYFKSNGLFIQFEESTGQTKLLADFTPNNIVRSYEFSNPNAALGMLLSGMENFLHAYENGELPKLETDNSKIEASTNLKFGLNLLNFGFNIRYQDKTFNSKKELLEYLGSGVDLNSLSNETITVVADLSDVRNSIDRYRPLTQKLAKSFDPKQILFNPLKDYFFDFEHELYNHTYRLNDSEPEVLTKYNVIYNQKPYDEYIFKSCGLYGYVSPISDEFYLNATFTDETSSDLLIKRGLMNYARAIQTKEIPCGTTLSLSLLNKFLPKLKGLGFKVVSGEADLTLDEYLEKHKADLEDISNYTAVVTISNDELVEFFRQNRI